MRLLRHSALLLSMPLLAACAAGFREPSSAVAAEITRTEEARFQALVRVDTAALAGLLAPDLTYTHSTGQQQNRRQFLLDLASRRLTYQHIEPLDRSIRASGTTALVTGRAKLRVAFGTQPPVDLVLRYTEVYVRQRGAWKLLAWHSSREG